MSMKSIQFAFPLIVLFAGAYPAYSFGAIVNGDFETPGVPPDAFAGWATFDAGVFFARPTADTDPAGRFVVFTEPAPASLLLGTHSLAHSWSSYSAFRRMQ